jgi:hypothetical protein
MEERNTEYQQRVRTGFAYEIGVRPEKYRRIDASPDAAVVQRAVRREAARLLVECGWTISAEE